MTHKHRMTWYIAYSCIYCLIFHVHYSHLSNSREMHFLLVARLARLSALDMRSSYLRSSGRVCWHTVISWRSADLRDRVIRNGWENAVWIYVTSVPTNSMSIKPTSTIFLVFFSMRLTSLWRGFARLICLILRFINCFLIFSYTQLRRSFFFGRRISQVLCSFPFSMTRSRCRRFEREVWQGEGYRRG